MRILVVGAGAVGGFFGGYLAAAGRDVTFLVRERRAAALQEHGLVIHTLGDDVRLLEPRVVLARDLHAPFDLVILAVKSFSLDQAMADIAPAVGPETMILPLLNGMRHVDALRDRFGDAVLGGVCFVTTTLDADDSVRQLGPLQTIVFGELGGGLSARTEGVREALDDAGFSVRRIDDIQQALWEKWFVLASGGALTTLLNAAVGAIESVPNGVATARAILAECASVAAAAGHAPSERGYREAERVLTEPGSAFTTSLFRDRAAGSEVEAEQILGDLVDRARAFGLSVPLLAAADAGLEIYRATRA